MADDIFSTVSSYTPYITIKYGEYLKKYQVAVDRAGERVQKEQKRLAEYDELDQQEEGEDDGER